MLTMNLAILDLLTFSLARVLYFEEDFCIASKDAEQPHGNFVVIVLWGEERL